MTRFSLKSLLSYAVAASLCFAAATTQAGCVNRHAPTGYVTWAYWLKVPRWYVVTHDGDAPTKHSSYFLSGTTHVVGYLSFESDGPKKFAKGVWHGKVRDFNSCGKYTGQTYKFQNVLIVK